MENITKWLETATALLESSYRGTVQPCAIQGGVSRYHITNKTIPNTNPKTNKQTKKNHNQKIKINK